MQTLDEYGKSIFIENFFCAIEVPSGKAGINFHASGVFDINTVILGLTYSAFVKEWSRMH